MTYQQFMKIFYSLSLLFYIGLFSCNNHSRESERMLKEFDSVNKSLEKISLDTTASVGAFKTVSNSLNKTNGLISSTATDLYNLLEKKWAGTDKFGKVRQMGYYVNDFYGYLTDLQRKFKIFCGDSTGAAIPPESEDKLSITNNFFIKKGPADYFFPQLKEIHSSLLANTNNDSLKQQIGSLIEIPGGNKQVDFKKAWFYNVPPVAALTLLNKFESDVRNIENKILRDCLKQ
jgi:GldM N-terminal domain